jgi:competence protein ComEA
MHEHMNQVSPPSKLAVPPSAAGPEWLRAWSWQTQLATAFLLGVATTLLLLYGLAATRWITRPTNLIRGQESGIETRIDVNRADRVELLQLPGVGSHMADRIENDREQKGPFRDLADLTRVPGIGRATTERLRPWVRVADGQKVATEATRMPVEAKSKSSRSTKKPPPAHPIDINEATAAELQTLPGIGPTRARQIIEMRRNGAFQSVEDLRRVNGIGAKTLERIRPYVFVEKASVWTATSGAVVN